MQVLAEKDKVINMLQKEVVIAGRKSQSNKRLPVRMFTSSVKFMQMTKGTPRLGSNIDSSRDSII